MASDVSGDQFTLIRIDGMHGHGCERTIQRALLGHPGVNEVEVDFLSGQASVLYDGRATAAEMMQAVEDAGYHAAGFAQGESNRT